MVTTKRRVLVVGPRHRVGVVTEGGSMRLQSMIRALTPQADFFSLTLFQRPFPFGSLISFPLLGTRLLWRLLFSQNLILIFQFTSLPLATFSNIECLNFLTIYYYRIIQHIAHNRKHLIVLDIEDLPKIQSRLYLMRVYISHRQTDNFTKQIFLLSDKLWFSSPGFLKYAESKLGQNFSTKSEMVFNSGHGFESVQKKILPTNAFRFIFAGNLHPNLGVGVFIDAFIELSKRTPNIEFHLCGLHGEWIGQSRSHPRIYYWGEYPENKAAALAKSCQVGLIGSPHDLYFEINLPAKLAFYALCGLPIIARRQTETAKLVLNLGLGTDSNYDLQSLARAMASMLEPRVYQKFQEAVILNQYHFRAYDVYHRALSNL